MNHLMDGFERVLSELGRSMNLKDLQFDNHGMCHFTVDTDYPITLRRDDQRSSLVLLGPISDAAPPFTDEPLWTEMLATGLGPLLDYQPGIGLDTLSGRLILHRTIPLSILDVPKLTTMLKEFIESQQYWSHRLAKLEDVT
jgi:hypothetical protein